MTRSGERVPLCYATAEQIMYSVHIVVYSTIVKWRSVLYNINKVKLLKELFYSEGFKTGLIIGLEAGEWSAKKGV